MPQSTAHLCVSTTSYDLSTTSKTKVNHNTMRQLQEDELDRVIMWLDQFELSKTRKVLSRDFSDGGKTELFS